MATVGPSGSWSWPVDGAEQLDPPRSPPPPERLRVTTFNVEYRTPADRLIGAVRGHRELARGDLFLLQEIEASRQGGVARAARFAAALGLGYVYAHGLAIVSRWTLRDPAVMALPRVRLPFNRHQRQRIALAATIATARGPLRVMTTHLDTRINAAARLAQLAPAVADVHPLQLVGGDLNTLPFHFAGGAVPIWIADQRGRLEAFMRGRGFDAPASAGATHRAHLRLDALFTRGFAPSRAQVADDVRVSDHFPLWADLVGYSACQITVPP